MEPLESIQPPDWMPGRRYDVQDQCLKCMAGMTHPFHDNGNVNEDCGADLFTGIDWFNEEATKAEEMKRVRDKG